MRDFLVVLQDEYEKLTFSHIGRLEPDLSADEVMSKCRESTAAIKAMRKKTDKLLNEHLYPMLDDIHMITDKDEAELFDFAQKLSSYAHRVDPGLALKVYRNLLKRARSSHDDAKIVKYLYWCGITSFFLYTSLRNRREQNERTYAYFNECSSYSEMYDSFSDPETRQYIHRSLGNKSMLQYDLFDGETAIKTEEEIFAFWNSLMFRNKDTDFSWVQYFMICLSHRHSYYIKQVWDDLGDISKDVLRNLLDIAITMNKLYQRNRNLYSAFGGTRYDYYLWQAQFLSGLISFDHLRDNAKKVSDMLSEDDFSADALFIRIQINLYLMLYAANLPYMADRKDEILEEMLGETMEHLSSIPYTVSPTVINDQLQTFATSISALINPLEQAEIILKMTSQRHIQSYAHSTIVGMLSSLLARKLTDRNPGCFINCYGICSADEAVENADKLCELAYTSGLCHDVGAVSYASMPFLLSRALTDDETELITQHTENGAKILERKDSSPLNRCITDVVLGHHKYYDNSGGYPDSYDTGKSSYKIIIDIVAIANEIDNATDDIIPVCDKKKSVAEACEVILSSAGTRFSPAVAELLCDESVIAEIDALLDKERKNAYFSAYLCAWKS